MRVRLMAVAVLSLAAGVLPAPAAAKPRARLAAFGSCPDLLTFARSAAVRTGMTDGVAVRALGAFDTPLGPANSALPTSGKALAPEAAPTAGAVDDGSSSTTNVQEAGVDEADIVKTDARHAYLLSQNTLLAYDIAGDTPRLLGSLTLEGYGGELLVRGSRLLVIGNSGSNIEPLALGAPAADRSFAPIYYRPRVRLTEVDISDPAALKVARTLDVDGSYVSGRLTGGTARIVLNTPPQFPIDTPVASGGSGTATPGVSSGTATPATSARAAAAKLGIRAFLPETVLESHVSGHTFRRPLVGCSQVRHAVPFGGLDLLTVLTIDLDHGLFNVDRDAVMAGAQVVYASPQSLYVASQRYVNGGIDAVADVPQGMTTEIHRFDTSTAGETAYRSSGSVPGFVLNQFALSEYQGNLRVASTEDPPWLANGAQPAGQSQSSVSVLDERAGRLQTIGRVSGLGAGERIYGVRFIADRGYVVTFRQVDPLFTLDLSKPEAPRVAGELKIAGYSAYLHPIGDDLLLGIGQDASAQGIRAGAQVSLFDVSDPAAPKRLDRLAFGSATNTEAEWDHHAFLWWGPQALAVLPLQQYGADASGAGAFSGAVGLRVKRTGGISEVGRIAHETATGTGAVRRSAVAGKRLITFSDRGIAAAELGTLKPLGFTALPQPEPDPIPAPVPGPKPLPGPLPPTPAG